ncbi:MAG: chemotaxis protein CheX [Magnetococcales bacterium]|nr:chemotaxis protein CheX [Magnetococcales bacterium]
MMATDAIVTALQQAVAEIASTALAVEVTAGSYEPQRSQLTSDYTAVISYSGALDGSFCLSGSLAAVALLASALLAEESPRDAMDAEMQDAFSELCNMMAGGVQSRLEATLGTIHMSTPVLIAGPNHQIFGDPSSSCLNHQFTIAGQLFFVEIFYKADS